MTEPALAGAEARNPENGNEPPSLGDYLLAIAATVAVPLALLVIGVICGGCVYKGAKVTEGTDLAVGINVPMTEGAVQLQLLNWLSGFRLGVAENAILRVEYATAETNDYFGVVHTRTAKSVHAEVEPCEAGAEARQPENGQPETMCETERREP